MPTVQEIEKSLYALAPKELAQSWDNVGLLVGRPDRAVTKIVVALDVTEKVVAEAAAMGAELIVAHHPLMNCAWRQVQTVRSDDGQGRLIMALVQNDISAICMHTNLDSAQGGVNDALAQALSLENVELFHENGIGRIGTLPQPMPLDAFLKVVHAGLHPNGLRYAGTGKPVSRVAVGGGACADMAPLAAAKGCDTFVTSDARYNEFLDAEGMGLNLIDAGHYPTEDVVCPVLIQWLERNFPGLTVIKSASHREVIQYYV